MAQSKVELIIELKERINAGLKRAKDAVAQSTNEMRSKLSQLKISFARSFSAMREEIPAFDRAIRLISSPITLVTVGILAMGTAISKSTAMALNWEQGMAKINVTAQLTKRELSALSDEMLNIGRRNVAPLEQIPDAFNKIISAGLDANQSIKVLEPTLRAAKAGFVDVQTVAAAGVNVMNSSGRDINTVYDVLFATLNKGAAEMADIATYLPKIIPSAKQAGFALGETAGAFAFLTAQGQKSEAAATLLQNAFKSLADPEKVTKFNKIGVAIYDTQGKMLPMIDIIKQLSASLTGLTDQGKSKKLASIGLDQEATSAFAVMIQDVQKLGGIIDATTNSQGALNRAYIDSMTSTDYWKITLNNIKYLMTKIGELFLPIVRKVGEWAAAFTDWLIPALSKVKSVIADWAPVIYGVAVAYMFLNAQIIATTLWTGILAIKTGILTAAQAILNFVMALNPISIIIIAIGALIGVIIVLAKRYEGWATVWEAVKTTMINSFNQYVQTWKFGFMELWFSIQIFWEKIKGFGQFVGQLFRNIGASIKEALRGNFDEAKKILTAEIKTEASVKIKQLEQDRDTNRQKYKNESLQRAKETIEAWRNVKLTRKKEDEKTPDGETSGETPTTEETPTTTGGTPTSESVAGSAGQVRNITINIDSFVKGGINAGNTEGLNSLSKEDIENWFNELINRTLRNVENAY